MKKIDKLDDGKLKAWAMAKNNELFLPKRSLEEYGSPGFSDIPKDATGLDDSLFQNFKLNKQDLAHIWNGLEKQMHLE